MQSRSALANVVWGAASVGAWRRYRRALRHPARTQKQILLHYLRENADTEVGRTYGFSSITSVEEYQDRVPLSTFDSMAPLVSRVANGHANVLTRQPVHRLVPSSGSTLAVKLLPYTRTLQREFSTAVDAWVADLYLRNPTLMMGPAYWSITPLTSSEQRFAHASHVPVGFDDDSAYLGGVRGALARAVMAVPSSVRMNTDLSVFRRTTLLYLLRTRDLRLMSVWHPSFLLLLLDTLAREWDSLVDDVRDRDAQRASELCRATPERISSIWPKLRLISCWSDGPARADASELASRTPGIELQPKGLLATEGVVTIPFAGKHPVAIRSHFFEFLRPDGIPVLAHQLQPGVDYSVVLTTGGGLYRYHLADRVIVDGMVGRTPSLTFVGKDDRVSDRFGEKLSDGFVATVLDRLFADVARKPRFAMVAPEETPAGLSYTLFVNGDSVEPDQLGTMLETGLRTNPHYAWCVDLGQLRPARVVPVGPGADRAYVDFCVAQGQRLGDIKPVSLHTGTGWTRVLPC